MKRILILVILACAALHAEEEADDDDAQEDSAPSLPPPPDAKEIRKSVGEIFKDSRYRFCHSPEYPLRFEEADWCRINDARELCPELANVCDKLKKDRESESNWRMPGLGSLPRILLLAAVLALLIYLAVRLGRHFVATRASEVAINGTDGEPLGATVEEEPAATVESDVARLLQLARRAAAEGQPREAVDYAYAALLRRLESDGLVRVEKWRTNGDYLRDLRARPDLQAKVREVVREVETLQFGDAPPSGDGFEALYARILPLVQGALIFLMCFFGVGCARRGAEIDSPSGSSAVRALLSKAGIPVEHRLKPLDDLADFDGAILLLDQPPETVWPKLLEWVDKGGGLVVAYNGTYPIELRVRLEPAKLPKMPMRVLPEAEAAFGKFQVSVPDGNCVSGGDILLGDKECAYAIVATRDKGVVAVLGGNRLFENAALASADNGAFLVSLLQRIRWPGDVQIVDAMTGQSSPNPLASLHRAGLLPLVGQLLLLVLALFIHRGRAFGIRRDPPERARRAFVEHVRALGTQYAKANALGHAVTSQVAYALERLRGKYGGADLTALAAHLSAKSGRPLEEVRALVHRAQAVVAMGATAHDVELLRELGRFLKETR